MTAYAIYRLPHEDHATLIRQTDGEPAVYLSCTELNGRRGFVMAPFQISEKQPILLIRPDIVETILVESGERKFPFPTCFWRFSQDRAGTLRGRRDT